MIWVAGGAAALILAAGAIFGANLWQERRITAGLRSPDPAKRRVAGLAAVEYRGARALAALRATLVAGSEQDPHVRGFLVSALGTLGAPVDYDLLHRVARTDGEPYVRHIAWLAAARADRDRFRKDTSSDSTASSPWDQIGVAAGLAEIGSPHAFDALLHWAEHGDADQRLAASAALSRTLLPLLESVGRWPLEYDPRPGSAWPAALVQEARKRLGEMDASAVLADGRRHAAQSKALRRNMGRLTGAREHLVRWLGVE